MSLYRKGYFVSPGYCYFESVTQAHVYSINQAEPINLGCFSAANIVSLIFLNVNMCSNRN